MRMDMGMRFWSFIPFGVRVPMVQVVPVLVLVLNLFMQMQMLMAIFDEQEGAQTHEDESQNPKRIQALVKEDPRQNCSETRRERKERSGLKHAQSTEPAHKQNDRNPE